MTIGLITVLVVTQVMQVAAAQKQAATSGADSIVNAALGLYTIERDGKNAGYGLSTMRNAVGCPIVARFGTTDLPPLNLVPATITDGAAGAPDAIRFLASSKNGITIPTRIAQDHPKTAANFFVDSDVGIDDGDLMLAVPATLSTATPPTTWCSVFQHHTGGGGGGGGQGQNQVLHPSGQSELNHPGGNNIWPDAGYAVGDFIVNLGAMSDHTYSINRINGKTWLHLSDFNLGINTANELDLYPNVVQLQAVYGKDALLGDGIVDAWDAAVPATAEQWQQIRAIRIAIVARSQNRESGIVTLNGDGSVAATTCNSATPHPAAVCWRPNPGGNAVNIDVSAGSADWQQYRYRVVETTIPLRNVIWQE